MRSAVLVKMAGLVIWVMAACATDAALGAAPAAPQLVRPDGTYPSVPLEKDVVVVKVVQNAPLK
jgi:hypothetical protein